LIARLLATSALVSATDAAAAQQLALADNLSVGERLQAPAPTATAPACAG
jgi:hypothetical protein